MAAMDTFVKREMKIENSGCNDDESMLIGDDLEEGEISGSENEELAPLAEAETILEDVAEAAKVDATKRFALIGDVTLAVPKEELTELYATLGVDEENERHYRFNTIHMRYTARMGTKDIYEYFTGLEPTTVEWLNKGVCNVIWDDENLPARALSYLSVEIRNNEKRFKREAGIIDSDDEGEELVITGKSVDASELPFPLPPGRWRKGLPYEASNNIIMRYANKDDKKALHDGEKRHRHHRHKKMKHREIVVSDAPKNPWGSLAQTWGRGEGVENYFTPVNAPRPVADLRMSINQEKAARFADHFLERAAMDRRMRDLAQQTQHLSSGDSSEDSEEDSDYGEMRKRKLPRMRADVEEDKQKIARLEAASRPLDLRARLNLRKGVQKKESTAIIAVLDEDSGDLSTDWATEGYLDIKRTLRTERARESEDEESELELSDEPGEMLQIEIDNDRYRDRRKRDRHS